MIGHEVLRDSNDKERKGMRVYDNNAVGFYGGKIISDTTETTPSEGKVFVAIKFLNVSSFTTLEGNLEGNINGITFEKGDVLLGRFTKITLSSGAVVAYEGR